MSEQQNRRTAKHKIKGQRSIRPENGGILCPDERKFEKETAEITERIKQLEEKIKPTSSNATQLIAAEVAKETSELSDHDKVKERHFAEVKAIEAKIKEVGATHIEQKKVTSDLLAGVRHKSGGRHDDAVERLEQQILIRRCSSSEERKFRHEIEKSKDRLVEYLAAKSQLDNLKEELEELRSQRDSLYRKTKELRANEMHIKDKMARLKRELEEAKGRKKVSISERDELKIEIDSLYTKRKQLIDQFRSEQLSFLAASNERLKAQRKEERVKREENRAAREAKKKYKAIELSLQKEQYNSESVVTCKALIAHLRKLSHQGGAILDVDDEISASLSTTHIDATPSRSESDPVVKPGEYILRREEEVLVPQASSLTRRRSRKDKRKGPAFKVSKRLNLNAAIFKQFDLLDLIPPNAFSDIPQTLASLDAKLKYLEGVTKFIAETGDSGVGSTAPSELMDGVDREVDFSNSQEDMNLDPGLGSSTPTTLSPTRSHHDLGSTTVTSKLPNLPQRSATEEPHSSSQEVLVCGDACNLVTMASSSSTGMSGKSISVGGGDE